MRLTLEVLGHLLELRVECTPDSTASEPQRQEEETVAYSMVERAFEVEEPRLGFRGGRSHP